VAGSPAIKITLDRCKYNELCAFMGLIHQPDVRIVSGGTKAYGQWLGGNVTIYSGPTEYDREGLSVVAINLARTLIHELRHQWQEETWPGDRLNDGHIPYAHRPTEVDARDYSDLNVHRFKTLFKVSRKFPSTGLSRLGKTEAQVRRSL
jgi:hypothetical protein